MKNIKQLKQILEALESQVDKETIKEAVSPNKVLKTISDTKKILGGLESAIKEGNSDVIHKYTAKFWQHSKYLTDLLEGL